MSRLRVAECVLSIDGVSHQYGATRALHDVSLQIAAGSIHALIGENGAGKSTLVKTMSGALQTDTGSMTLRDETFAPSDPSQARNAGVATVYQELSLAPHLTVAESLFLGREPTRFGWLDTSTIRDEGATALARLDRIDISLDARILDLSIADRQIVEIARALHGRADLLILDEPTSSLTGEDASQLFDVLRRLRDDGLAILYISHFLEEIIDLTDQYTVLRDGEVTGHGATSDMDATRLATLMVGRPLQKRSARTRTLRDTASHDATSPDPALIAPAATPSRRAPDAPASTHQASIDPDWRHDDILLHVDSLHGAPLPMDASIELRRGEILGIGGLVGSGRSELVRS
ncbi:MAG: sugar ABC transporter ATP-binding protein, partial [Gemmatimonadetes bacterium]|nr:sugar ABC transporter ATP-binding protein [Gemmatimonadota bacterium]